MLEELSYFQLIRKCRELTHDRPTFTTKTQNIGELGGKVANVTFASLCSINLDPDPPTADNHIM